MDSRGYYGICAGIIERAVDDYKTALRYLMSKGIVKSDWNLKEKHFRNRHHREAWNVKTDSVLSFLWQYFEYLSLTEEYWPS